MQSMFFSGFAPIGCKLPRSLPKVAMLVMTLVQVGDFPQVNPLISYTFFFPPIISIIIFFSLVIFWFSLLCLLPHSHKPISISLNLLQSSSPSVYNHHISSRLPIFLLPLLSLIPKHTTHSKPLGYHKKTQNFP